MIDCSRHLLLGLMTLIYLTRLGLHANYEAPHYDFFLNLVSAVITNLAKHFGTPIVQEDSDC